MDKIKKNKKLIINSCLILLACLAVIYIFTSLFAKKDATHIVPEALDPYFLEITKTIKVRWYAVCILTGAVSVAVYAYYRIFRHIRFDSDNLLTGLIWGLFSGVLGARLYYVLFEHDHLPSNVWDAFLEIIGLGPNGLSGLAIHGGIYATIIFLFIFCKVKKLKMLHLIEIVLPCFMIAQAVGRWGNFFNQEAFGPLVNGYEDLVLTEEQLLEQRLTLRHLLVPNFVIDNMYLTPDASLGIPRVTGYYYPTFYFESVLNFVGAATYLVLRRKWKKIYIGDAVGFYLTWYGIVRFIIESMRTDPLMIGNIRVALLTSVIFFVLGVLMLVLRRVFKYKLEPAKVFFENGTLWLDENKDPFKEMEEKNLRNKLKKEEEKNESNV
ncbi:MAG: prolipoprotein diacylglyceryl transferase [Bacilli bacterium]|nr:prolipoprotein diacylglyceryl transferase [Bacilli bacterium]